MSLCFFTDWEFSLIRIFHNCNNIKPPMVWLFKYSFSIIGPSLINRSREQSNYFVPGRNVQAMCNLQNSIISTNFIDCGIGANILVSLKL